MNFKWKAVFAKWIALMSLIMAIGSCNGSQKVEDDSIDRLGLWGIDPENGEIIYECEITNDNKEFTVKEMQGSDGCHCISIEHNTSIMSEHYRLYSPNGNLRIIASGGSEEGGIHGYRIDYDGDGKVVAVTYLGSLNDDQYSQIQKAEIDDGVVDVFKRWLSNSEDDDKDYRIIRDSIDNICSIGDIEIPADYQVKYYIKEWGPFWTSCLDGGQMAFFVMLEKIEDIDGSYVNYLYCGNKLIAEIEYCKDTFIKARTYNRSGAIVKMYDDRKINLEMQSFYDQKNNGDSLIHESSFKH